jgi:hypothetical protein
MIIIRTAFLYLFLEYLKISYNSDVLIVKIFK